MTLPVHSWNKYQIHLKGIGERQPNKFSPDEMEFLQELNLVNSEGRLTYMGNEYFLAKCIKNDTIKENLILRKSLLEYGPAVVICQLLKGVPNSNKNSVETLLRYHGYGDKLSDRKIGILLSIMNQVGVISYNKKTGIINVKVNLSAEQEAPANIFISPDKPFSNKVWLRKVLEQMNDHIYWFDKHFFPMALEELNDAIDGNKINEVKILSLDLGENTGKKAKKKYQDLKLELASKNVNFEWRLIDSTLVKPTHDRWVFGSNIGYNIPDVGSIYSGKHSELNRSCNLVELHSLFQNYWDMSVEFS